MAMPLVSKDEIVEYLRLGVRDLIPVMQVIDVYPSADDIVSYGLYVQDVVTVSREIYQLAVQKCGAIYTSTDQFNILYVSFQNDPQADQVETLIQALAQDAVFFDGYNAVTFSRTEDLGNRSEKHTYTFDLQRTEFNN